MAFKPALILLLSFTAHLLSTPGYFEPWGKDDTLSIDERTTKAFSQERTPLIQAAETVIAFHQKVISPADGPRSHFRPTSARYMLLSMQRYGFFKGYLKGCDRLLRENSDPWVYWTITIDKKKYKFDPTYSLTTRPNSK